MDIVQNLLFLQSRRIFGTSHVQCIHPTFESLFKTTCAIMHVFQNEDHSITLSLLDVASHLKQTAILSVLGTSVDYTPSLSVRESSVSHHVQAVFALLMQFLSLL